MSQNKAKWEQEWEKEVARKEAAAARKAEEAPTVGKTEEDPEPGEEA
jgi:hypothetical protein